jgi:iron complex transport system substrate-binding protein
MRLTTKATVPLIVLAFVMAFLGACAPIAEKAVPPGQSESAFPITVTDQTGREIRIEKIPERIVSLAPGNTEIVYALGLEEKLVGVTEFCDYPEAAKDKPKIGGFSTVDIERVVESQPDLILAASIHKEEVIPRLEGLGLTVIALAPKTVDEVLDAIALASESAGEQEEAAQLIDRLGNRVKAITDKTEGLTQDEKPRVFYVIWHDPLMTIGSETRIHQLIESAGGTNIAQGLSEEYPTMSLEAVIVTNPQIIIAGSGMGEGASLPYEFALTEERLSGVDARVNSRIYEIDTDLVGRTGPRIVDGLEQLAIMIHPELFE